MIIDMHCDTISEIRHRRMEKGEECGLRENALHIDARRLKESGYMLQCFALFVSLRGCGAMPGQGEQATARQPDKAWAEVEKLHRVYRQELENCADLLLPVENAGDLEQCRRVGKVGALLTVEEGGVCGGSLKRLEELYDMGVRMLTLTWNFPNEDRGGSFVGRMEEMGMLVDVSHLSDRGFWDVAEVSRRPFVASHSNARSVCPCVRNLTDEMIRVLSERGGVMGLNFCTDFLRTVPEGEKNPGRLEDVAANARHILQVGGEDCLGLGSDFDGIETNEALPGAQAMEKLWETLRHSGFTERQLDKVFHANVLRVLGEIL